MRLSPGTFPDCPTPHKFGYEFRAEARKKLRAEKQRLHERTLEVYLCQCGLFHLGNRTAETRAAEVEAVTAARVRTLAKASC